MHIYINDQFNVIKVIIKGAMGKFARDESDGTYPIIFGTIRRENDNEQRCECLLKQNVLFHPALSFSHNA